MTIKTSQQLMSDGLYFDHLAASRKQGTGVERLRRGVFLIDETVSQHERHRLMVQSTVPILAGGAVVSHASAAVMHGLPVLDSWLGSVWVTELSRTGTHKRAWLHSFHGALDPDEIVLIDGIAVTSMARTCVDLARYLPRRDAVPVIDAALARGLVREEMADVIARGCGVRGNADARWASGFADATSESFGEGASRVVMHQAHLPAPELQQNIYDAQGRFIARGDFVWRKLRVVGEFDGMDKYDKLAAPGATPRDVLLAEKDRDERLRGADWWPVHWWWSTLRDPTAFKQRILRAFENQAARR